MFGKPLKESLKYASVQISTANANGELYVWGYIPVVVAKWCVAIRVVREAVLTQPLSGLYLKEAATEMEGTFRVNGSNRRMRELQAAFEAPPRVSAQRRFSALFLPSCSTARTWTGGRSSTQHTMLPVSSDDS